jgi:hypothetical protein
VPENAPNDEAPQTTLVAEVPDDAPQTTLKPLVTLLPHTTDVPQTTELPETFVPHTTEEPQTTDVPQTTDEDATVLLPFDNVTGPVEALNVALGDKAAPTVDGVRSLLANAAARST